MPVPPQQLPSRPAPAGPKPNPTPLDDRLEDESVFRVPEALSEESEVAAATALEEDPATSDQIHVLGSDVQGRYFTHLLSSRWYLPPVRFLVHRRAMQKQWEAGGKRLHLYRGDQHLSSGRAIAELVRPEDPKLWGSRELRDPAEEGPIDQLIVTVPACSVVRAFAGVRHRVDEKTTICLVQDGLGVAEALNETYFPDPSTRPAYVLGHMTHQLHPVRDELFSLSEFRQGRLYLSALRRDQPPGPAQAARMMATTMRYHPPVERLEQTSRLLRLLTTTPGLQAGGFPVDRFLRHKLPSTVFKSVVDPLTVVLDCTYDKLAGNAYARQLMDQLLGEILAVVGRLPELRGSTKLNHFRDGALRGDVFGRLAHKKNGESRMQVLTRRGWESDIEFLNGYFVRRGRDVGVRCPANETVMGMVKAKHAAQLAQRREEVAFE